MLNILCKNQQKLNTVSYFTPALFILFLALAKMQNANSNDISVFWLFAKLRG